jgi:hypothetical protein
MKIRFNMEIRGCEWWEEGNPEIIWCPYFTGYSHPNRFCIHKGNKGSCRKLPKSLNPSWCPMVKEA